MLNPKSKTYKLFYKDALIGNISEVTTDWPWFIGDIEVTSAFEEFRAGFDFLNDEDNPDRFAGELPIDLENWFIEDEDGNRVPADVSVHEGKEVWWRW